MLRIVTDGAADMPPEWCSEYEIHVLPLRVVFGNKTYTAGVDLSLNEFYSMVRRTRIVPKTSLPSPGQVAEFYRGIARRGDDILSVHIASRLSGTFATVTTAAQEVINEFRVYPFDSGAGSAAMGLMCREARRLARLGRSPEQILARLGTMREQLTVYFTLDNVEFAYLSGRVNALQNALSSLLKVKPIIVLRDGLLEMAGRVRTRQRAIETVLENVRERIGDHPVTIAVVHAADPETARAILERLRGMVNIKEALITDLAIPVAANLGPGTIGIVALAEEEG
jgi:DegV family protein with EDD domain